MQPEVVVDPFPELARGFARAVELDRALGHHVGQKGSFEERIVAAYNQVPLPLFCFAVAVGVWGHRWASGIVPFPSAFHLVIFIVIDPHGRTKS